MKPEIAGVENYSKLTSPGSFAGTQVGFGGATAPSALPAIKDQGFGTIVNLRLASEDGAEIDDSRLAASAAGLNYIHFPFDSGQVSPGEVEEFLELIADPANQPVYIHCGSATRASALWMIGRVLRDDWSVERASEEAEQIAGSPERAAEFAEKYLSSH